MCVELDGLDKLVAKGAINSKSNGMQSRVTKNFRRKMWVVLCRNATVAVLYEDSFHKGIYS